MSRHRRLDRDPAKRCLQDTSMATLDLSHQAWRNGAASADRHRVELSAGHSTLAVKRLHHATEPPGQAGIRATSFRVAAEQQFLQRLTGAGMPAGPLSSSSLASGRSLAGENDYTTDTFQQDHRPGPATGGRVHSRESRGIHLMIIRLRRGSVSGSFAAVRARSLAAVPIAFVLLTNGPGQW